MSDIPTPPKGGVGSNEMVLILPSPSAMVMAPLFIISIFLLLFLISYYFFIIIILLLLFIIIIIIIISIFLSLQASYIHRDVLGSRCSFLMRVFATSRQQINNKASYPWRCKLSQYSTRKPIEYYWIFSLILWRLHSSRLSLFTASNSSYSSTISTGEFYRNNSWVDVVDWHPSANIHADVFRIIILVLN